MITNLINKTVPTEGTVSGTTGSTGNLKLTNVPSNAKAVQVLSVTDPYYGIPFKSGNDWYAKCIKWNQATYVVASSEYLTAAFRYWGGVLDSPIFNAFSHFFKTEEVAA